MAKQFTLMDYYKGRNVTYAKSLTIELVANAQRTVECLNKLFIILQNCGIATANYSINSGWRPKPINDKTPGADPNSPHVTCEAVDVSDPNGVLKKWIATNYKLVKECGFIATESPGSTPTWLHLQIRPPLSWQQGKAIWLCTDLGWKNNFTKKVLVKLV